MTKDEHAKLFTRQTSRYFDPKKARKLTNIRELQLEVELYKGLNKVQEEQLNSLKAAIKQLIEKLAGLGLKVKFEKGQLEFEAVR